MDYSQWSELLASWLGRILQTVIDYLPNVLGAVLLLALGWLLARLFRGIVRRLSRGIDWLLGNRSVDGAMKRIGVERPASEIIASIVYWAVMLVFITAATETLGLPVIATWIGGLSYYLPRVVVALMIVFAGLLAGNLAGDAISRAAAAANIAYASLLGRSTHLVILVIAIVTGVEQLGIDTEFLTASITLAVGAVVGGVALAFGLGARAHVGNLIASHYLRQVYRVGQIVRVSEREGRIVEIGNAAVLLETEEGRVMVPAAAFSETASVLVPMGA